MKIWKWNTDLGAPEKYPLYVLGVDAPSPDLCYSTISLSQLIAELAPGKVLVDKDSVIEKPSWDDAPEWAESLYVQVTWHGSPVNCDKVAKVVDELEYRPDDFSEHICGECRHFCTPCKHIDPKHEACENFNPTPKGQRTCGECAMCIDHNVRFEGRGWCNEPACFYRFVDLDSPACLNHFTPRPKQPKDFVQRVIERTVELTTSEPKQPVKCCGGCGYVYFVDGVESVSVCPVQGHGVSKDLEACSCHTPLEDIVLVPGMVVERKHSSTSDKRGEDTVIKRATGHGDNYELTFITEGVVAAYELPLNCTIGEYNEEVPMYPITRLISVPEEV